MTVVGVVFVPVLIDSGAGGGGGGVVFGGAAFAFRTLATR
jgi:hypothetical protein